MKNYCSISHYHKLTLTHCNGNSCSELVSKGCGKTGIRTLGTRKGTTVFETVPFDRSGIFP